MLSLIINPLNQETAISNMKNKGYSLVASKAGKNRKGTLRIKLTFSK